MGNGGHDHKHCRETLGPKLFGADQAYPDRVLDQPRNIVDLQLLHQLSPVRFYRFQPHVQGPSDVVPFMSFHNELQDFPLPRGQLLQGARLPDIEITAYRIIQEGLTNIARHAGVRDASVRVWAKQDIPQVQIEDLGGGFDSGSQSAGVGLTGMRQGATAVRGPAYA